MKRSKVITAVIAIIAVVAAACVYGYVRSKPADEPEKPAVTEPENPTTPETPDDSNSGKPSDSKTDKPAVQPENPNPSGTESVTIYVPDEQGETLTPTGADAKDDSDQSLVDALIAAGSLPEGVSFSIILMNILVPHIEHLTTPKPFGTVKEKKKKGAEKA